MVVNLFGHVVAQFLVVVVVKLHLPLVVAKSLFNN
jgi:hypothetical protein